MGPELTIIRGLPGSGKTTYAKSLKDYTHLESDMYFIDFDGNYKFDPQKLPNAHDWCYKECMKELLKGNKVVVSNTFTMKWELKKYLDLIAIARIPHQIIRCIGNYGSIHNVPEETLLKMKERFEDIEGEIII